MSDQPLFQNTDEQEAIYAPQQLPDGDRLGQENDDARSRDATVDDVVVPAAGAGLLAQAGGGSSVTGAIGPAGAAPAVGAAALADADEDADNQRQ